MKKHYFSQYLTAFFLLLSASITQAQIVSVTGNVYEKNTVKNSFKTPRGTITTILPDDMAAGDVISGTVLYDPGGSNKKEIRNNLEQLSKYTISLENGTTLLADINHDSISDIITEGNRITFRLAIPPNNDPSSLKLLLKDPAGKIIGESKLPLLDKAVILNRHLYLDIQGVMDKATPPTIQTDKTVYMSGENAVAYMKYDFEHSFISFVSSVKPGEMSQPLSMNLVPLASSPRKTVIQIPNTVSGPGEIILQDENKKLIASQKIHVLKLEASCPKTNLMKGEETVLNVKVIGVRDCPADYLRLTLDNTTSAFVQLGHTNHEELVLEPVTMNYSKIKKDYKELEVKADPKKAAGNQENFESNQFSLQRSITALKTGGFVINIGLSYPSSVYNDPFWQQLDALKTVEQFNGWQNALKNDLVRIQARNQLLGEHISDGMITHRFSPIVSPAQLDEAKSLIYAIINIPRIGQEVVVDFICTPEAGNAALENAMNNTSYDPVNYEVIKSALKFAEHQATVAGDNTLKNAAAGYLKQDLWKLQRDINNVSEQLQLYSNIQKVIHDASKAAVRNMESVGKKPISRIGMLDPFTKTLWVAPEEETTVLQKLGASKQMNGTYLIHCKSISNKPMTMTVSLMVTTLPLLNKKKKNPDEEKEKKDSLDGYGRPVDRDWYEYVLEVDPGHPAIGGEYSLSDREIAENRRRDSLTRLRRDSLRNNSKTEFANWYRDSTGTVYNVYRNAQCVKVMNTHTEITCAPNENIENHSDSLRYFEEWENHFERRGNNNKAGQFIKLELFDRYNCVGGDDICVSKFVTVGLKYVYSDRECKKLIEVIKIIGLTCE